MLRSLCCVLTSFSADYHIMFFPPNSGWDQFASGLSDLWFTLTFFLKKKKKKRRCRMGKRRNARVLDQSLQLPDCRSRACAQLWPASELFSMFHIAI